MKKWISIVPAAALILGAAACERSDYVAQEHRTALPLERLGDSQWPFPPASTSRATTVC